MLVLLFFFADDFFSTFIYFSHWIFHHRQCRASTSKMLEFGFLRLIRTFRSFFCALLISKPVVFLVTLVRSFQLFFMTFKEYYSIFPNRYKLLWTFYFSVWLLKYCYTRQITKLLYDFITRLTHKNGKPKWEREWENEERIKAFIFATNVNKRTSEKWNKFSKGKQSKGKNP